MKGLNKILRKTMLYLKFYKMSRIDLYSEYLRIVNDKFSHIHVDFEHVDIPS